MADRFMFNVETALEEFKRLRRNCKKDIYDLKESIDFHQNEVLDRIDKLELFEMKLADFDYYIDLIERRAKEAAELLDEEEEAQGDQEVSPEVPEQKEESEKEKVTNE
ncbi:hypothetical protein [Fictibacillus sp. NRS-1165]|uniref:hypothetical protein n=1 Tax=Fictibacillus sp. NRS-1165 TaxID=3144463 RepID=UPI003D1B4875